MNSREDSLMSMEGASAGKKHKKHKHKKHRKRKPGNEDFLCSSSPEDSNKYIDVTDFPLIHLTPTSSTASSLSTSDLIKPGVSPKTSSKKKKPKEDSESSEEEQRWLDAIQEGKLEEVEPELKNMKIKDPKLMTARQRAMLVRKGESAVAEVVETQQLISLPSGYKEKVMTPEQIKKAEANKEKMRKLHDEKRAKEKKKTLERLLRKQEAKSNKLNSKKSTKKLGLTIKLINNVNEIKMVLPPGVEYPLKAQKAVMPTPRARCAVDGCKNDKIYNCSKTNVPLCSLQCYKKNLEAHSPLLNV